MVEAAVESSYRMLETQLLKHEGMLQVLLDRTVPGAPGSARVSDIGARHGSTLSRGQQSEMWTGSYQMDSHSRIGSFSSQPPHLPKENPKGQRANQRASGDIRGSKDTRHDGDMERQISGESEQHATVFRPALAKASDPSFHKRHSPNSGEATRNSEGALVDLPPGELKQVRIENIETRGRKPAERSGSMESLSTMSSGATMATQASKKLASTLSRILPDTYGTVSRCSRQTTLDTYAIGEAGRSSFKNHVMQQMKGHLASIRQSRATQRSASRKLSTFQEIVAYDKEIEPSTCLLLLARFTDSKFFASLCAAVILANVIFVGYEVDASMQDTLSGRTDRMESEVFRTIHRVFDVLFLVELVLRMYVCRWFFVFGPDVKFNALDTLLVLLSIVEECLEAGGMESAPVVRELRMLKVLRLARMLRFFCDLRLMVASIVQSCASLTWALLLLGAIMYLFAIVFMHGLLMQLSDLKGSKEAREPVALIAANWYNNVPRTMMTLLQCISSGVDWDMISRPLSWLYTLVFAFYISFVVIGVLNVLTGIFVDRASELSGLDRDLIIQSHIKRDRAFHEQMRNIFEEVDSDGSGCITWLEFKEYLKCEEVRAYLSAQQLDACDARQLFDLLDAEGNTQIELPDFIMGLSRLRGMAKSVDVVALLRETRDFHSRVRKFMDSTEKQLGHLNELENARNFHECFPEDDEFHRPRMSCSKDVPLDRMGIQASSVSNDSSIVERLGLSSLAGSASGGSSLSLGSVQWGARGSAGLADDSSNVGRLGLNEPDMRAVDDPSENPFLAQISPEADAVIELG